jgi:hypothetical protein
MNKWGFLLLGALMLASAGCAQHSAYVVARRQPGLEVSSASKIAFAAPASPQSRCDEVCRATLDELKAGGFRLVAPAEADYQLIVLLDKSTRSVAMAPAPVIFLPAPDIAVAGAGHYSVFTPMSYPSPQSAEELRESAGIRLTLYPTRVTQPAQLQAAWDGYVDSGRVEVPNERYQALLQTLLRYFGQDFIGRAKFAE